MLYQFQRKQPFNRHLRFDCDNPKTLVSDGVLEIETGPAYRAAALYPIDFFIVHDDALHIVPAEALTRRQAAARATRTLARAHYPMARPCPPASAGASPAKPTLPASR